MIANSFLARFNAWLLKSEYTIVTSLQPNKFKDIIFKIIANISSTLLSEIDKCHMKCLTMCSSVDVRPQTSLNRSLKTNMERIQS